MMSVDADVVHTPYPYTHMEAVAQLVIAKWRENGAPDTFWEWAWSNLPKAMTAIVTLEYENVHGGVPDEPSEWTGSRWFNYPGS